MVLSLHDAFKIFLVESFDRTVRTVAYLLEHAGLDQASRLF